MKVASTLVCLLVLVSLTPVAAALSDRLAAAGATLGTGQGVAGVGTHHGGFGVRYYSNLTAEGGDAKVIVTICYRHPSQVLPPVCFVPHIPVWLPSVAEVAAEALQA